MIKKRQDELRSEKKCPGVQIRFVGNIMIVLLVIFLLNSLVCPAQAEVRFDGDVTEGETVGDEQIEESPVVLANEQSSINLDKETIAKGYTVTAFNDLLKLSLVPGILSESTRVDTEIINEDMPIPWNLEKISPIYQFEFRNKTAYDNHKPFYIQFSYDKKSSNYKRVFFYDKNYSTWRELPTRDYPEEKFVRSLIHLPYARIVVLESDEAMTSGRASWYAYKGGNFAASPDFPKGSRLRVYNQANLKYVDVVVNDYGPDRSIFPDRAIDLDKVAFSKIASVGAGVIDVNIEPLYIVPDVSGKVLGVTEKGASELPITKARASLVMNEETGEILFEKNIDKKFPIASLTKLVAMKVFFDQKISLDKEVIYMEQDELYNYEYCESWESAKLRVKQGDIMTVEDLVYSSLIGSANNAVETLVRVSGISRLEFIKKMNDFVKKQGAQNTNFIEPTGLSPNNVSTARDYAIIIKEVFKSPIIEKISITPKYKFYTVNTKEYHKLINTNYFIRSDFFATTNNLKITGSKTGYLDEALHCLITRAQGPNKEKVLVVNLGAPDKTTSFEEVKELIKYGIKKTQ